MPKKTLILAIALVILIALAYVYQGPLKNWQNNLGKPKNILAKIKLEAVDKIEIIYPVRNSEGSQRNISNGVEEGKTLTLTKQNQKWQYDNSKDFYADPAVMERVFSELKTAALSELELVSNNRERKSQFKTDSSGQEIKLYQADKLAVDFIIGSQAGDYVSSYISSPESAATYAVKADLAGAFSLADWRDFTIFSAPKEKINKIRFQYPNREFTVELKNGRWSGILPDKFVVKPEKIQPVLEVMSNLKAAEIPAQVFAGTGLDQHLIIIQATGEGVDNVLMVGSAKDGLYYAKKGDSDNIYLIAKSQRDELDKNISQLK
ncbi:MAG: DUF4340 domain-containing protein [Parcubacteria group bacterium]|nr:DUF4340 domain-containing protein [Parcubacteria group bacterium]